VSGSDAGSAPDADGWIAPGAPGASDLVLGPYVLQADASGLHLSSPKGGTSSPWSSCRSVATDGGHLVLELRTDERETIRIVPWAGLDPETGQPEHVLATIQGWIAAASGDAPGPS
jgi:hypothetical protein